MANKYLINRTALQVFIAFGQSEWLPLNCSPRDREFANRLYC